MRLIPHLHRGRRRLRPGLNNRPIHNRPIHNKDLTRSRDPASGHSNKDTRETGYDATRICLRTSNRGYWTTILSFATSPRSVNSSCGNG